MNRRILLSIAMVMLACIILAAGVNAEQEGGYYYLVHDGEVIITDVNTSISGSITVPSELGGFPVTAIGNNAFEKCTSITEIILSDGIRTIGQNAFSNCTKMARVSIPYGVTSIGSYAFFNCDNLTSIVIPEGVTEISQYTFSYCDKLSQVTLPNGVTSIGAYAFRGTTALKNIILPMNLTFIGEGAFWECTSLNSITLPNGVTSIGIAAFYNCHTLTAISIPNSITSIGMHAFHYTDNNTLDVVYYKLPNLTIYGYTNSYAQTYASKQGIKFYSFGDVAKPVFVTNLADSTYSIGETAVLTVLANAASAGTITYQWYVSNTADGEGTAISGATEASYIIPTDSESVKYYYVIAVNTNEAYTASAKSAVAKITVGENGSEGEEESITAEVPLIFAQTSSSACRTDEEALLFVSASVTDGGVLSYQWYVSDTADEEGTPIEGAVSAGYKPSSETAGTKYYYVVITNTKGEFSTSVKSDVMVLAVGSGYITGDVNSSGQTDSEDSRILKQYFAGYNVEDELTNPDAADINSDGRVARNDAGILARYIDGWREYSVLLPSLSMK